MPRQGGQGKGKPKLSDRNFGAALSKAMSAPSAPTKKNKPVMSVLQTTSLDDFIESAEQGHVEVIRAQRDEFKLIETTAPRKSRGSEKHSYYHFSLPRKPKWSTQMSAEDIDRNETAAFMSWRRSLADAEESSSGFRLTPFEKNLDVWRQLWRAIERSDILIQIVDARDPLFH
jgi:large subunit GTPase 1